MEVKVNERDWAQKYRPTKLEDMILPNGLQSRLLKLRDRGVGPSMLFHGKAGTGKTTAARLLHTETLEFNSSSERKIADIGNLFKICQTPSLYSNYRVVLLDEADNYTANAQADLRNTLETLSFANMFVLTANNPERLSAPLHSRLLPIDFSFNKADVTLKQKAFKRVTQIVENEGFKVDKNFISTIVDNNFPDMRKILKVIQYEIGLSA